MKIIVRAERLDGSEKYRWPVEVLARDEEEIVVRGVFSSERRVGPCTVASGDTTIEHYRFGKWFNICRIYRPTGQLTGIYCNLAMPPRLQECVLSYVDLELDLFVRHDGSYTVLDQQDFERLAASALTPTTAARARAGWAELIALVERHQDVFAETRPV